MNAAMRERLGRLKRVFPEVDKNRSVDKREMIDHVPQLQSKRGRDGENP